MPNISKKLGEILVESSLVSEQQLLAALAIQETKKHPIGEILVEQGYVTKEKLDMALAKQAGSKLGEILISAKIINFSQLQKALEVQRLTMRSLGDILIEENYVNEDNLLDALSKQYHLERVDLGKYNINPTAFSKVPVDVLKHYKVIPIDIKDGFLVVATSDPEDVLAASDLSFISGMHVKLVLSSKKSIWSLLE